MEKLNVTITFSTENGKELTRELTFEERENSIGMKYVVVFHQGEDIAFMECRNMIDYSLKNAANAWITDYFGSNLVNVSFSG